MPVPPGFRRNKIPPAFVTIDRDRVSRVFREREEALPGVGKRGTMASRTLALVLAAAALAATAAAQQDSLEFTKLKDFTAHRSSSSDPDPASNNDSKHPIPARP